MASSSGGSNVRSPGASWPSWVAVAVGLNYLVLGVWAYLWPNSFYSSIASFPPNNHHFLRDAGALQIGIGLAALLAARKERGSAAILAAVAATGALHLCSHFFDLHEGGHPARDLPFLIVLVLAPFAAAIRLWTFERPST